MSNIDLEEINKLKYNFKLQLIFEANIDSMEAHEGTPYNIGRIRKGFPNKYYAESGRKKKA